MNAEKTPKSGKKPASRRPRQPDNPLMLTGRDWNRPAVMDIVCAKVASSSKSTAAILAEGHEGWELPDYSVFRSWLRVNEVLSSQYAVAKQDQAEYMETELLAIADDGSNDWMDKNDPKNPGYMLNGEHSSRSRLRIDTRKWLMGKLKPKVYGEKTILAGDPEAPLGVNVQLVDTADELAAKIRGKK